MQEDGNRDYHQQQAPRDHHQSTRRKSPVEPKAEQNSREPSLDSISSPGPDQDVELDGPASPTAVNPPVQKRKGGRKPIYATSEERKQRNRQAQAAFRERRTEYIKQLETTIKQQDETLQGLQQSHRSAADECLMLRYKNSLLERILLEKGIDVQAELKKKEIPVPGKLPPALAAQAPLQRPLGGRLSRPGSGTQNLLQKSSLPNHSPQLQPTPPSQSGSPTTARSPTYGMGPPGFRPQPLHIQPGRGGQGVTSPTSAGSMSAGGISSGGMGSGLQSIAPNPGRPGSSSAMSAQAGAHWPSPFQTHISQLEQEYDAPDLMEDDTEEHAPTGPGPYPTQYAQQYTHTQHDPQQQQFGASQPHPGQAHGGQAHAGQGPASPGTQASQAGYNQGAGQFIDPFDPMLDADPFGLTASMHFPTSFGFQESSMRK